MAGEAGAQKSPEVPPESGGEKDSPNFRSRLENNAPGFIYILVIVLVVLMVIFNVVQIYWAYHADHHTAKVSLDITLATPIASPTVNEVGTPPAVQPTADLTGNEEVKLKTAAGALAAAEEAKNDAQDTLNMSQAILSFLQGASVLVALALGAAAIYGFRKSEETREEFRNEGKELKELREKVDESLDEAESNYDKNIEANKKQVDQVEDALEKVQKLNQEVRDNLSKTQEGWTNLSKAMSSLAQTRLTFLDLMDANQELQKKNYEQAYAAVQRIMERDPNLPEALYIAGWLELQYIPDKLNEGLDHLQHAYRLVPDRPSVIAAYGVALRRKALQFTGEEQSRLFIQAEGLLLQAVGESAHLLDFNGESLWGPVAGIRRDRGDYEGAIQAYEAACQVTPGSSYPYGNLGALYLLKGRDDPQSELRTQALKFFKRTVSLASVELALAPNDYFHIMDIAMSALMLTQHYSDSKWHREAPRHLDAALSVNPTPEMLGVSLRGWVNLLDYCPLDWVEVVHRLMQTVFTIASRLVKQAIAVDQSNEALYKQAREAIQMIFNKGTALPDGLDQERAAWEELVEACPKTDEWAKPRTQIEATLGLIQNAIAAQPGGEQEENK